MQHPALRGIWALQRSRGGASSALQQLLSLIPPVQSDGTCSSLQGIALELPTFAALRRRSTPVDAFAASSGGHAAYSTTSPASSSGRATVAASATGAYSVEVAVQGFEKRYVDMACSAIDDIIILAFAPKSYAALPTGAPAPHDAPLNLALGSTRRDVRLPWKRTRFTLLRSPHIDKQGMEQFERREYKSVLTAATNSRAELQRLMEALKIYQFTGVQIRLDVTSAQQLELPADVDAVLAAARGGGSMATGGAAVSEAGSEGGQQVLGSATVPIPAPHSPEAQFEEELRSVLRLLRPLVWSGLKDRRQKMESMRSPAPEYAAWRQTQQQQQQQQRGAPVLSAAAPGGGQAEGVAEAVREGGAVTGEAYGELLRQRMQQQLEQLRAVQGAGAAGGEAGGGSRSPATVGGTAAAPAGGDSAGAAAVAAQSYGLDPAAAAELLARIDSELLHARADALQGHQPPGAAQQEDAGGADAAAAGPPVLDAEKMTPAEYAHAVLKYVQYVDWLQERSPAAVAARQQDRALQLAAPSLALRLLQLWWAATSIEFKRHLGLPPAEVEKRILEEQLRQQEAERQRREAAKAEAERDWGSSSGRRVRRETEQGGGRRLPFDRGL